MQNDKEAKAPSEKDFTKFKSLYYGVDNCAFSDGYEKAFTVSTITLNSDHEYLLLRSVKHISKEHKEEFAKLCYWNRVITDFHIDFQSGEVCFTKSDADYITITLQAWDYLRSKGYLIPFTTLTSGEVKTYSEEEILANQWAKIKED